MAGLQLAIDEGGQGRRPRLGMSRGTVEIDGIASGLGGRVSAQFCSAAAKPSAAQDRVGRPLTAVASSSLLRPAEMFAQDTTTPPKVRHVALHLTLR